MTTQLKSLIHNSTVGILHLALAGGFLAIGNAQTESEHIHAVQRQAVPAKLVQIVHDATKPFTDVNVATAADYHPFLGCVSGPDHGAMGTHYVNLTLVGDGEIDAAKPEALIYETGSTGLMTLVGVEFIVDAATWLARHPSPPVLEGQSFHLVNSPNRYNLPAFFELHVWAWRNNPSGAFVDWNNNVSCEGNK